MAWWLCGRGAVTGAFLFDLGVWAGGGLVAGWVIKVTDCGLGAVHDGCTEGRARTPMTTTKTLADVAATSLNAVRILESHGLDYCCGGKQAFDEACLAKGLSPEGVLAEVEQAQVAAAPDRDWQSAPLGDLVNHIVSTHHELLKRELPVLSQRMEKVKGVHGHHEPEMWNGAAEIFAALREEMEMHMQKEEEILFPYIGQYGRAESLGEPMPRVPFGTIARPIHMMEMEHESAGGALVKIRALTRDYELPEYACSTVRALFDGLKMVEADLHVHIHLENNILFPRAVALETRR